MKKYKFKDLRTFASDEWMANATKKYRKVFDKAELTYVRAEFSFYNKLFDEENWNCTIILKCFEFAGEEKKEICSLDTKREVKMDENIVYLRDGWGNPKEGVFWKSGSYVWEAWIDEDKVGEVKFIINEIGKVTINNNPYFKVNHLKIYCGDFNAWESKNRVYLKTIKRETTQYVWGEMEMQNKSKLAWDYELTFNFLDDAHQLKGQVFREGKVEAEKENFKYTFDVGWGNDVAGSWKDESYFVEVIFMDTLVAQIRFEVGALEVEGSPDLLTGNEVHVKGGEGTAESTPVNGTESEPKEETMEELLAGLDTLIGLTGIKKSVRDHISYLNFLKLRKEKGFEESGKINLHSVFTGNPGTGKTTVVNMLGKIYKKMGLLSKGHVVEVDRADLVGEYIGQTAPKTKKAIESARGGILFIDEAYSLARAGDDAKDFGKEVVEILLKEMSDGIGDIAIMGAGYPKEMDAFLDSNPGMKSRFSHYYEFEDYLPDELQAIAIAGTLKKGVKMSEDATKYLAEQFIEAYRTRDRTFGNARMALGIVESAKMNMALRLMQLGDIDKLDNDTLSTITLEDVEKAFGGRKKRKADLGINEKMLRDALDELNGLTGMSNIKAEVNELVKLVRFYRETGKDVLNRFSLHGVFTGNPGTGKTTVARIMAKIYKGLGLIEKGHIVEVDREGLVAGYVGQTAIKTAAKIDEAIGGVLFIDEAYGLSDGSGKTSGGGNFGDEAIQIILKRMEDQRGQFAVIVAGYPDNMRTFIEANPGLKSRFDRYYEFYDYSAEELYTIARVLLDKEKLTPTPEADAHLKNYLKQLYEGRDKFFGNARSVRQVIGESVKNQHLRMASLPSAERTKEALASLTLEDVSEFVVKEEKTRSSLGFRYGNQ
ncbi:MAG TPA: AAA family ATPase [Bacteroidia bacterium]|nr:AAA family ATPase [Bacteroidia bacterium]